MSTYYLLRAGSVLSRIVPLAVLYALAGLAARLAYLLPTAARAAARANIARVLAQPADSPAVKRAAAQAFRCQALNYVDMMRLDRVDVAELEASVVHGDIRPFVEATAEGKGAIILTAHLGNMDYVAQWLALHGYRVHAPMERLRPERLFRYVVAQREARGLHLHPVDPKTIGVLTRALRAGEVVAIIADRDIGATGEPVAFFGAETRLPIGPALLAVRTGAPIVPAFGRRLRDNRMYVTVYPAVRLARTHDLRADVRAGLRRVAHALELGIRRDASQWIVFEPIWKDGAA